MRRRKAFRVQRNNIGNPWVIVWPFLDMTAAPKMNRSSRDRRSSMNMAAQDLSHMHQPSEWHPLFQSRGMKLVSKRVLRVKKSVLFWHDSIEDQSEVVCKRCSRVHA